MMIKFQMYVQIWYVIFGDQNWYVQIDLWSLLIVDFREVFYFVCVDFGNCFFEYGLIEFIVYVVYLIGLFFV